MDGPQRQRPRRWGGAEVSVATALGLALGYAADAVFGDPRRGHPVALFGALATRLERVTWADRRGAGVVHVGMLVTGVVGSVVAIRRLTPARPAVEALLTAVASWVAIGGTSLGREGAHMHALLVADDLSAARVRLSHLCGRDASTMDGPALARATVESLAENTSDAVVAPLVWGALAGAPGILGHRALNTLDAMIGYRTARYRRFGWAAARLDDLANLLPARLTALLTVLLAPVVAGDRKTARATWRRDAGAHPSPNAGPVEAAMAGALAVRLGGASNTYGEHVDARPAMGPDRPVTVDDIARAVRLGRVVGLAALVVTAALAVTVGPRGGTR